MLQQPDAVGWPNKKNGKKKKGQIKGIRKKRIIAIGSSFDIAIKKEWHEIAKEKKGQKAPYCQRN